MTEEIRIGNSDVQTGKLGLGTNKVGGHNLFAGLADSDGTDIIKTALQENISLLDTAYMYGLGKSEELIGDVLKDYDRSKVVIATKAAQDPANDLRPNNQPDFLKKSVDSALKRLKTDYIDIFYIHFPDDSTPKDEAVAALVDEKKAGKIRAIGVSNFSLAQVKEANKDHQVDIVEDNYSLVHRNAEKELMPYLQSSHISFVPYFPLASGLLTGKYDEKDQSQFKQFAAEDYTKIINALAEIKEIANRKQASIAQTVLAWYIADPAISVVIPGAHKAEQVQNNVKALNVHLSDDEFKQIDHLFQAF
ncbi:aldo/keto reductase [Oenococcus sicerae]|mgnify:CR=1 FL=1|uniref:Aldo/keto reductase n=1 Tax=Oenococcus sicerae TaxID=2203724 RepID=A0AAJ1R9Y9_9LACO|nr:aldo/keto reductase [Oenococcus sicerae]MDN6900220.1 aldo/keto reductase [Oenococcus sicerae]QAS69802.1 aldo/keto reductase [Oenococcus sicerae]